MGNQQKGAATLIMLVILGVVFVLLLFLSFRGWGYAGYGGYHSGPSFIYRFYDDDPDFYMGSRSVRRGSISGTGRSGGIGGGK